MAEEEELEKDSKELTEEENESENEEESSEEEEIEEKEDSEEESENRDKEDSEKNVTISKLSVDKRLVETFQEDFSGIRKDAHYVEGSFTIKNERGRLSELLTQTGFNPDIEEELKNENLEGIAVSAPAYRPGPSQDGQYEESPTQYLEESLYQNNMYQEGGYESVRNYEESLEQNTSTRSNDPQKPQNAYTPKPVESFNEQNQTSFALGAKDPKEESKEKYRLR